MTEDRLEAILTAEEPITPPTYFLSSVMEAVHRDRDSLPPLPFPWPRWVLGLGSSLTLAGVAVALAPEGAGGAHLFWSAFPSAGLAALAGSHATWGLLAGMVSAMLVRFSLGLTSR